MAATKPAEVDAPTPKKAGKQPLPAKYKGTKRYRLTVDCYRKGLLTAGSVISVTDEVPSKTWIEVDGAGKAINVDEDAPAEE